MTSDSEIKQVHLVVFVHGLWGNPGHLQYLVDLFSQTHGDKLHLLNAKCNTSDYTYDGVDLCGERLVNEIKEELKSIKESRIKKFSIIGYSLGGLVSRYAIGLLYSQGFFKDIEPTYFITFATPHLGIRREDNTKWIKFVNWTSSNLLSKTGEQLQYIDKFEGDEPLLYVMSKPDTIFYKALESFKNRKIYANARKDHSVPFWTAAITDVNPFDKFNELNLVNDEKCEDIIDSISLSTKPRSTEETYLLQKSTIKTISVYLVAAITLPVLIPIVGTTILPLQLMKSKQRIQKVNQEKLNKEDGDGLRKEINTVINNVEEAVVDGAMNLNDLVDNLTHQKNSMTLQEQSDLNITSHEHDTPIKLSNFTTSPLFPRIPICEAQNNTFLNLNKLTLDKTVVCIKDDVHPHASIIARNNFHTGGKDMLKIFVEHFQP